jgi:hypothetical protein
MTRALHRPPMDSQASPPPGRRAPPLAVPTLTEVVDTVELAEAPPAAALDEEQLVQRVLLELQRHVDLMLEFRLREALAPVLARATQTIVDEARGELSATLRDVVGRAVAQEVARQRQR